MSIQSIDLIISSKQNVNPGISNPVRIPMNNISNIASSKIIKIVIKSASIVNNFYNIRNGINNKLYVEGTSGGFPSAGVVTIPEGQYTTTQLIDYLNSTLPFINFGATLSFDTAKNRIITTVTGATSFSYLSDPTFLLNYNTTAQKGAFNVLGLVPGVNYVFNTGANMHPNMCDLSGVKNIYVETNFSQMNAMNSTGYKNIAAIIPLDIPYLSIKSYINQEQLLEIIKPSDSQNLSTPEITFYDIDGNILNTAGINWEMVFKIYYLDSN